MGRVGPGGGKLRQEQGVGVFFGGGGLSQHALNAVFGVPPAFFFGGGHCLYPPVPNQTGLGLGS